MDKDKVLEGILTTRLLSGDLATFMTELLQLNITPSEARTMDIFGDPAIGELVAKVLESKDDAEASQPALQELRDYLAKSSDVTAKDKAEAAPAEAEVEMKATEAEDTLTKNVDDAVVKPEEIKIPELKSAEALAEVKALFSTMQEKLEEEFKSIKESITDMQDTLREHTEKVDAPTLDDTDVEQKNFSADTDLDDIKSKINEKASGKVFMVKTFESDNGKGIKISAQGLSESDVKSILPGYIIRHHLGTAGEVYDCFEPGSKVSEKSLSFSADNAESTPVESEVEDSTNEGEDMENTEKKDKEFDILREMIFSLMPEDKKEAWAKKYAEAMGKDVCPECGDSKEEFCDKTFDDEPEHEEEKKDDFKEAMVDLLDALKDLRDELKKEDEPAEESKEEEAHEDEKPAEEPKAEEEPKKDEGLTEEEIKAIEDEGANFSQKPVSKIDVFSYLYGDK